MPYTEFLGWQAYFEVRPPGWREDQRTMPLLQIQGLKAKPYEIFPSLLPIIKPQNVFAEKKEANENGFIPMSNLKDSGIFNKLRLATDGDIVPGFLD
jgi:hypothetical protein